MNMQFKHETEVKYKDQLYYAEIYLNITEVVIVPPDPMCRTSDYDFYGFKEMEFDIEGVHLFDENGEDVGFIDNQEQIDEMNLDWDKMENWLWEQLEDIEGDYDEYAA